MYISICLSSFSYFGDPIKSMEKRIILAHSERYSPVLQEVKATELEAAGHILSTIRKEKRKNKTYCSGLLLYIYSPSREC